MCALLVLTVSCYILFFYQVIICGRLLHRVKVEDSLWTVNKGEKTEVHINLEKTKEVMWKSVFEVIGN